MSISGIINAIVVMSGIALCYYVANRIIKNSQLREVEITQNGLYAKATILSMKQNGIFINNNPVLELKLKIDTDENNHSWLVEKHQETALLIALSAYDVGGIYEARIGKNENDILLVKDESGKPVRIE
ncbi:hypothetical protein FJU30_03575 [Affinibrenneria salicis]|uniref:Uncharacterized protein n=1 Tax=Affinibrenneria salicis TaxID=2590031 RepID=A0A5J5G7J6_9GAMM|nr:hypothetical protein [Affinibrenneria salicis]KAA9002640.1 hypothetical protein FJU30_01190 [Affinibrenneria salicis]KAA9003072.1 hypothetical protein FJU30_03575 [Affinibrenneria salicis]